MAKLSTRAGLPALAVYPATDWTPFTPTGSWTTNTAYTGLYRQDGADLLIQYYVALSGAPNAVPLTIDLPPGFSLKTSSFAAQSGGQAVGEVRIRDGGVSSYIGVVTTSAGSGTTGVLFVELYNSPAGLTSTAPFTFGASDTLSIMARIPVNGFTSSSVVGQLVGGVTPLPVSAALTAQSGIHYLANTSAAAFTITLPVGVTGMVVKFSDAGRTWDVNNLTIQPATGQQIGSEGVNQPLVGDVKGAWFELAWNGSVWILTAQNTVNVPSASALGAGTVAPYNPGSLVHGGTYSPSFTVISGLASANFQLRNAYYQRVGPVVSVWAQIEYGQSTSAGVFEMTLPILSDLQDVNGADLTGIAVVYDGGVPAGSYAYNRVWANPTTNRASVDVGVAAGGGRRIYVQFGYLVQ